MKKLFLFIGITLFAITACTTHDEPIAETGSSSQMENHVNSDVTVSEDGYLIFPTTNSLEKFFEQLLNKEQPTIKSSSRSGQFVSIAMLDKKLSSSSRTSDTDNPEDDDLADLETMTFDEYNLMKSEELLLDNLMFHAMDTTMRIVVEDYLYKVTIDGTFGARLDRALRLDSIIPRLNPTLKDDLDAGQTIQLEDGIYFTNTFKNIHTEETEIIEEVFDSPELSRSTTASDNNFHLGYNTKNYTWKKNNILDWIRGNYMTRENNFNKNYRVSFNVFDVNYAFYQSAGVRVRMQQRKKFLGIPYWKNCQASKLAIGFNSMEGVLTYNNPNNLSRITPTASAKWKSFTGALNGVYASFIYGAFHKIDWLRDWSDYIWGWMPDIKIGDTNYTNQILNKLYDTPAKAVYYFAKNFMNKTVYAPIVAEIKPKSPMIAYFVWGTADGLSFTKEHTFVSGAVEYESCNSKSLIFDRSFGVHFAGGYIPTPYLPTDFKIKSIDIFGAAQYNHQWLGVRYYSE